MAKSATSFRPKWSSGPTRVLRVPEKLASQVLQYARELDSADGEELGEPGANYRTAQNCEITRPVNVASVPHRSPFRYPGGKTWLVPYVRSWLGRKAERPAILIEPFAGGGTVGLTAAFEGLADHVLFVEKDPDVAAVWQTILCGQAEWLARRILDFEMSGIGVRRVFDSPARTQRERAFATVLRNRVNRGGILAAGAGLIKEGENGKGLHSRWYPETLARRIRDIALVKERITFIEGDAAEIIQRYADEERAAFFVDPPYTVAAKRLYSHWQIDHGELFSSMNKVAGDVLLTYDDTAEIRKLASTHGFSLQPVAMKNTHHAQMTELLIGTDMSWLTAKPDGSGSATRSDQAALEFRP